MPASPSSAPLSPPAPPSGDEHPDETKGPICHVWAYNAEKEMDVISSLLDQYSYVSMDTEFPGVVIRPIGAFRDSFQKNYKMLKSNADTLKLIQLGLTLSTPDGRLREGTPTWQFHFKYDLSSEIYAEDSIALLRDAGVDFSRHATDGD
eukprot:GABV01003637.1.p1 GENE.GABV01003637.1~~GABV01003637.1.p1  ORF type:complete len:169 (+),score=53.46 GABV01003637.1:63-509(+)